MGICEACDVSGRARAKHGQSARKSDVILPYWELCLITSLVSPLEKWPQNGLNKKNDRVLFFSDAGAPLFNGQSRHSAKHAVAVPCFE